ncbi:MAG: hypothetical protein ACI35R_15275 [Bacillus sp. (in: firmicutes)]
MNVSFFKGLFWFLMVLVAFGYTVAYPVDSMIVTFSSFFVGMVALVAFIMIVVEDNNPSEDLVG